MTDHPTPPATPFDALIEQLQAKVNAEAARYSMIRRSYDSGKLDAFWTARGCVKEHRAAWLAQHAKDHAAADAWLRNIDAEESREDAAREKLLAEAARLLRRVTDMMGACNGWRMSGVDALSAEAEAFLAKLEKRPCPDADEL